MLKQKFIMLASSIMVLSSSFSVYANTEEPKEFVIYHTNDTHSRVDAFPYVSTLIKESTEEGANVLYYDAGDTLHGQPLATTVEGESIVNILNAIPLDAMTLGNHEFNYGLDRLIELSEMLDAEMVASNVYYKGTDEHVFEDYFIKEVDGVKIGIFGLATPETYSKTNPLNVENVTFADPTTEAERVTDILKNELGCDVVIAITHLGVDESTNEEFRSTYVAENVDGIDIMIDGHSHTTLENGIQAGDTLVVQTGEYGDAIGKITFDVVDGEVVDLTDELLIPVDENGVELIAPDQDVLNVIEEEKAAVELVNNEVVATTPYLLEGTRELVRTQETNLANLITDAMIYETGADVAITNGGGIRASIEPGDITKGDVVSVLPFGNFVTTQTLTGAEIIETLEHGYSSLGEPAGFFAQIGGLNVELDPSAEVGNRIISATFDDGTELIADASYKVATNDFMSAGGDNYTILATKRDYIEYSALDEVVINYLNSGTAEINENPRGRIVIVEDDSISQGTDAEVVEIVTSVEEDVYTVVKGDCLYNIGQAYGIYWGIIATDNNIESPYIIYPDQKLIINKSK